MAKKTSIKGSMQDYMDYLSTQDSSKISGKIFEFVLIKENLNPAMTDVKGKQIRRVGSHRIETFGVITETNEKKQRVSRTIRYLPTEQSIYKDLQSDDKDVPKKKFFVEFVKGRKLVVADTDPLLLEWLMKCNLNESNEARRKDVQPLFKLYDNSVAMKKKNTDDDIKYDAIQFARKGDWDEVEALALVMNIKMDQTVEEIRYNMRVIAERDPEMFMRTKDNPLTRKKFYVMKAINEGYLVIDHANNSIAWKSNPHNPLDVAPINKNIVDSFAQVLSTDAGQAVYEALVAMVNPAIINPKSKEVKLSVPSAGEVAEMTHANTEITKTPEEPVVGMPSDAELEYMFDEAVTLGVIVQTSSIWYTYKTATIEEKVMGKPGFLKKAKANIAFVKSVKFSIQQAQRTGVEA